MGRRVQEIQEEAEETMQKNKAKITFCVSCNTDLRGRNAKFHRDRGHTVRELTQKEWTKIRESQTNTEKI